MRRQPVRRPQVQPEVLESRQLLAAIVRGVDIDGDRWVLRLHGPGDLSVVNQPDANDDPVPLGEAGLIQNISISGTDPTTSQLRGRVRRAATGDGKVFFAQFQQFGGRSAAFSGSNLGTNAIDMPNFWLGQTSTEPTAPDPDMDLNFGVSTLRFGGADTTFTPPGGTPLNQNGQSDTFSIRMGLPFTYGTSIVVDQVITSAQAGQGTAAATQDGVEFRVHGRVNTFQANGVQGNTVFPSSGFLGGGGTVLYVTPSRGDIVDTVVSSADAADATSVGAVGFVRVGGNATNFSVEMSDRIANFYIGGETSNVNLLAPEGARNLLFGKGMDDTVVRTGVIDTIQANRGAVRSSVTSNNHIGRVTFGGDVVNTTVLAGYQQDLLTIFRSQTDPGDVPPARSTASINNVLIAGDVVNSVFAASVQPAGGVFGAPGELLFPHSFISAKVEGTIDNSDATPDTPDKAFFAKQTAVVQGPVNPPNVVEPPFRNPNAPPKGPRVYKHLQSSRPAQVIRDT